MKCIVSVFLGIVIFLILTLLFICMLSIKPKVELFKANSNLINQEPINFKYLTNPNYDSNILDTYYLDDDKKISGKRVVNHPYMYSYNKNYGYYFWFPLISNNIYNSSGVRL